MDLAADRVLCRDLGLRKGLSIPFKEVLKNEQAYFVIYEKEEDVRLVISDAEQLKKLAPYDVVVTSQSKDYDFISRYFWSANGGDEDPVTGSAHTGLAPFWANRTGKNKLRAYQASKRGGILTCEMIKDRVLISGHAVQYLEGVIEI